MNIETRQGCCKYCGQIGFVEAPEIEQNEIDNLVTHNCSCEDACWAREEEKRQQEMREAVDKAKKSIVRLFGEDWKQAMTLLTECVPLVAGGTISQITVKRADQDTVASLTRKSNGYLRVVRKDLETRVEE